MAQTRLFALQRTFVFLARDGMAQRWCGADELEACVGHQDTLQQRIFIFIIEQPNYHSDCLSDGKFCRCVVPKPSISISLSSCGQKASSGGETIPMSGSFRIGCCALLSSNTVDGALHCSVCTALHEMLCLVAM